MTDRTCSIDGCGRPHYGRGWCNRHWQRWRTKGAPDAPLVIAPVGAPMRWLIESIAISTGDCLEWPFGRSVKGYGILGANNKCRQVTHVALEMDGHPRPSAPGDNALHSCDNPPCCNPRHLRWGTQAENQAEMYERNPAVWGEDRWNSKLTEDQVRDIRARDYSKRGSKIAAAREFGVSKNTIRDVISGHNWKALK